MADPKNVRSPKASFDHVIAMLKHILFRLIPTPECDGTHKKRWPGLLRAISECLVDRCNYLAITRAISQTLFE